MKKRIISLILAIIMVVPMLVVVASAIELPSKADYFKAEYSSEQEKLEYMGLNGTTAPYLENENMEFYVHPLSGEIGIKNKLTGEIMLSNPYNVSKSGTESSKQQYLSTLILSFKNVSSGGETIYYSYKDSAVYDNQMKIDRVFDENGKATAVVVTYEFGKKEMVLPLALHNDDLERIFADMRAKDAEIAEGYIKNIQGKYEFSKENNIWVLRGNTSVFNKNKLVTQFEWVGYDIDKMHADYEKISFDFTTGVLNYGTYVNTKIGDPAQPYFKAQMNYTLTSDGFNVSVDTSKIEYDSKNYTLGDIGILPFFNFADHATDNGYTFIPDGSGALIRYEDLRASGSNDNVTVSLYGPDYAYYKITEKNQEQVAFPVFGNVITTRPMKSGFFAIIENGDAHAKIKAHNDTYFHSVYSSFQISASDKYDLADSFSSGNSSSNVITVNGVTRYNGTLDIKYVMLTPSKQDTSSKYDTSYIGMANYYRDYLQNNGTLNKLSTESLSQYTKIFLEVFGSLQVQEKILTFPVMVNKELTTFADIMKMHKELSNIGVDNMSFILTGFANGGLSEKYPTYLKWQNVLGGAQGFAELMSYAQENGIEIAPSVNFSYAQELKSFSGFGYKKTAAKALDGRREM